jgi:Transcriptional regulators
MSRLFRVLRAQRPEQDLSPTKLLVLGRLKREGPSSAADLAGYLRVQPQSLTRLLDDLERRGLITKRPSSSDRRQVDIAISGQGTRALAKTIKDEEGLLAQAIRKALTPMELELLGLSASLFDKLARELGGRDEPS